jgi:DNA processing protein
MLAALDKDAYLAINYFQKISSLEINRFLLNQPELSDIMSVSALELSHLTGMRLSLAQEFIAWRRNWKPEKILAQLTLRGLITITWQDDDYPSWLKNIPNPPPLLYYQGKPPPPALDNLTVVGSREPSSYSQQVINNLLPPLIKSGFNIISGLALGVDTLAHLVALKNKGKTWAVLGSGLDIIYPRSNLSLAQQIIAAGGGLISEFPPSTPPRARNFPSRNRIISGLSLATIVIEAKMRSGSLSTARHALEQGRDVLSVPGSIFSPLSTGTNQLIISGATPITSPNDLLDQLENLKLAQGTST